MNRAIGLGVCAAAGLLLQGAITAPATAAYLGYGNGDPGNWSLNTEQAGGPCNLPGQRSIDPATGEAKCCSQYTPMSLCPLAHAPGPVYRHASRRTHSPS